MSLLRTARRASKECFRAAILVPVMHGSKRSCSVINIANFNVCCNMLCLVGPAASSLSSTSLTSKDCMHEGLS